MTLRLLPHLIPSIVGYLILLGAYGYIYGGNDQMDFMPYAMHIQDPSLFVEDFYVNCISLKINERYLISHFIALFPIYSWKVLFYLIHAGSSIFLISGIFTWTSKFIDSTWLIFLTGFTTLVLSYNFNLGGNELYYNMVCGSLIAKSVGIWALWHAYNSKWIISAAFAVVSTYFHPIAGFQVLILSIVLLNTRNVIKYLALALVLVAPYVFLLIKDLNTSLSPSFFSEIMRLRNAHHFFPSHFGLRNYLLLIPLFLMGTYFWRSIDIKIFWLCLFILTGCIFYVITLSLYPKLAIQTQWFKTTIWLKFFSLLAIIKYASSWLSHSSIKKTVLALSILFILFRFAQLLLSSKSIFDNNDNIRHAENIMRKSKSGDVYIVSPAFTEFKFYSRLSTYVDWKAIPHNGTCLMEWYRRVNLAYGLGASNIGSLRSINEQANDYLLTLSQDQKAILKSEGVSHIIVLDPRGTEFRYIEL